ncbi:CDP-glycerol glycerophosphotransferase family protein [Embleya sp. NPDC059237]|uniref:bifunctional glycosyltransferase/CDP-glycerol:glycerophosphate glycerophosphotransferase n=1 Tax=Embleya sp. NPDC059237 TaxID=3346784 RepID=UPI0036870DC3
MSATEVPDISVVVIVYNDARRLVHAVASVLGQTLANLEVVIVDDHSTDDSFAVAERFATEHPGKVRAIRLPENSGGCSRPRNVGIDAARGTYVMFLDSDDVLDRHACKNMLVAADETAADLVSGLCVRVHLDKRNKVTEWYPALYRERAVLSSVAEKPELLYDTLSTNKCYRRAFLNSAELRFPEGYHYEDLLFSARAYLAASKLTLIPSTIYHWNVVEKAEKLSISNRRNEISNFIDRVRIHQLIDDELRARGEVELKLLKDRKFIQHDLVLYLWGLPFQTEEERDGFIAVARPYLETLDPRAFVEANQIPAIAAYLVLRDDRVNLIPAIDFVLNRSKITSPLHLEGDRVYWCAGHLDDELGRQVLDVTDTMPWTKPLKSLWLGNELTSVSSVDGVVRMSGVIVNPVERIGPDAKLSAHFEFLPRRKKLAPLAVRRPVQSIRYTPEGIVWEAEVDLADTIHPIGLIDPVWDVRLIMSVDGEKVTTRIFGTSIPEHVQSLPARPRLSRLAGDQFSLHITSKGHLAFELIAEGSAARRSDELLTRAVQSRAGVKARGILRTQLRQTGARKRKLLRMGREVLGQLPVRKGTAVFESHLGKQYGDSPRHIYEELRRSGAPIKVTWVYAESKAGFPADATLVKRGSWAYYKALAQAEFWVDNQGFPGDAVKNRGTTYIQTWHGSALKRMGFDMPSVKHSGEAEQRRLQEMVDRFDHFVVRSEHDVRTLVRGYRLKCEILRIGYPRNDALIDGEANRAQVAALREQLGLAGDERRVVLYAPTFRQEEDGSITPFTLPFDPARFVEEFGDRFVLLVRTHYLNTVMLPPSLADHVKDASTVPDVTQLLQLTDVLITDYSSLMFDYALLDRPMVFFTYDYDAYTRQSRGAYFDLAETAPGPLAYDEDQLFGHLRELDAAAPEYAERRRDFVESYGEYDHGTAAKTIVERFFLGKESQ